VWVTDGVEMGAHAFDHADLGQCDLDEARFEIVECRVQLEPVFNGNEASSGRLRFPRMATGRVTIVPILG
jgi:hypothetical protein